MEEIYVNVDVVKPVDATPSRYGAGPRDSKIRFHRGALFFLGLLSLLLLAATIGLGIHSWDLSAKSSNLTKHLQTSISWLSNLTAQRDQLNVSLTEKTEELGRLQSSARLTWDLTAKTSNLTKHLQTSINWISNLTAQRDQLNVRLTEKTEELGRLQSLTRLNTDCTGWTRFHCSCYIFSTESRSWEESRRDCRDRGADLVVIDSFEEQEFLSKSIKASAWIGLTDSDTEGTFKWVDGTTPIKGYWYGGQPDNGGSSTKWGEEDCVHFQYKTNTESNWNDLRCDSSMRWICEKQAGTK